MAQQSGHIDELQSVRGIAATAVMIGHALVYYDTPPWFRSLAVLSNGRAAVVVFFVLSGYVLTRSLRNSLFDRDAVSRFYVQRLFRIYPAIWAASALGLLYIVYLHWQVPVDHAGPLIRSEFRTDRYDMLHIVASIAAMTTFILPPLWSIFVELVASLLMPGIAFVTLHRRSLWKWMLAGAVLMSFVIPNTYYHTTMYLMDFVLGAALTIPGLAIGLFGKLPVRIGLVAAGIGLLLTQHIPLPYYSPYAHIIETLLAATIIGLLVGGAARVSVLRSRFLLLIGDTSYSIYLFHFVVLCTLAKVFALLQAYTHTEVNTVVLSILLATFTVMITVPLAWLSYTFVEKPGIQLGKFSLQRRWALRRAG